MVLAGGRCLMMFFTLIKSGYQAALYIFNRKFRPFVSSFEKLLDPLLTGVVRSTPDAPAGPAEDCEMFAAVDGHHVHSPALQ